MTGAPDDLLGLADIAGVAGVGSDTVKKWVYGRGIFPPADETEPYGRRVRRLWRRSTVEAWLIKTRRMRDDGTPTRRTHRWIDDETDGRGEPG